MQVVRSVTYATEWSSSFQTSQNFEQPEHVNPDDILFKPTKIYNETAHLGQYHLTPMMIEDINGSMLELELENYAQVIGGRIQHFFQ